MFRHLVTVFMAVLALSIGANPVAAALTAFNQDFEGLVQADPDALNLDGWLVFGNVTNGFGEFQYGYGPFPAPNDGAAFSGVATGEGGPRAASPATPTLFIGPRLRPATTVSAAASGGRTW